jgi:hypothetical protein
VPRGREGRGRSTREEGERREARGGSEVGGGRYAAPILLSKLVIFFLQYYTNDFYRPWLNMYLRNQVMKEIKRSLHFSQFVPFSKL